MSLTETTAAVMDGLGGDGLRPVTNTVRLGDREVVIERPSGRKASAAFKRLRRISNVVKDVTKALGEFEREYAKEHVLELDRVQARMRYPAQPLVKDGELVREPTLIPSGRELDDGEPELVPNPRAGEVVYAPSPIDAMTADDWQQAGHVLRRPEYPSQAERVAAVFDLALEHGEEELYRLLALFTLSNQRVTELRKAGGTALEEELERVADEFLDEAGLDELLELAVVCGEVVDEQFRRKAAELGAGRMGKALRLLGITLPQEAPQTPQEAPQTTTSGPEEEATPSSSSTPTSSTDSAASTDGGPTSSSTPPTTSSSPLAPASTMSAQ